MSKHQHIVLHDIFLIGAEIVAENIRQDDARWRFRAGGWWQSGFASPAARSGLALPALLLFPAAPRSLSSPSPRTLSSSPLNGRLELMAAHCSTLRRETGRPRRLLLPGRR